MYEIQCSFVPQVYIAGWRRSGIERNEEKKKKKKGKVELHDEMKANYKEQGNKESCNINGDILLSSVWNYE